VLVLLYGIIVTWGISQNLPGAPLLALFENWPAEPPTRPDSALPKSRGWCVARPAVLHAKAGIPPPLNSFSSHSSRTVITDPHHNPCEDTSTVRHREIRPSPETNSFPAIFPTAL